MDVDGFSYFGKSLRELKDSAYSGGEHSQVILAEFYASGYQVEQNFFKAYAWAYVAAKNGSHSGDFWEKKIWYEFKSDAERRKALLQANELFVRILGTTKR